MFQRNKLTFGLISDTVNTSNFEKENEKKNLEKLNLSKIIQVDFPDDQYYKYQTNKKQIVLHHTVSGQGVDGDIAWWRKTSARIATHIIIGWDGKIYQCYSSKYWGHHLGCKTSNNTQLNKKSIGIEIDSWGGLVKYKKQWYPAKFDKKLKKFIPNTNIKPIQNVELYPNGFRGFYGFEKYSEEQIESLRKLLVFLGEKYKIPLNYNENMWDYCDNAIAGEQGVWSHVSYRKDKSDCYPDKDLITMLKSLK